MIPLSENINLLLLVINYLGKKEKISSTFLAQNHLNFDKWKENIFPDES